MASTFSEISGQLVRGELEVSIVFAVKAVIGTGTRNVLLGPLRRPKGTNPGDKCFAAPNLSIMIACSFYILGCNRQQKR